MFLRVVAVALVLLVAGCSQPQPGTPAAGEDVMPADFAGTVEYGNGSVPPPYHFEWVVRFDAKTVTVDWTPGYEDVEPWTEAYEIDQAKRAALYADLRDIGVFTFEDSPDEGLAGGSIGGVELVANGERHDTGSLGTSRAGQDVLDEVVTAVKKVVPADMWTRMEDKQTEWSRQQPQ
jgi:hypothetical protein